MARDSHGQIAKLQLNNMGFSGQARGEFQTGFCSWTLNKLNNDYITIGSCHPLIFYWMQPYFELGN
jgi:hypothetical protein